VIFTPTPIDGAQLIDIEPHADARGFFARTWCRRELEAQGLDGSVAQESVAFNAAAGTLRGMHYLVSPRAETKVVRCLRGELYDVILDLRADSPSYRRWYGVELTANNHRALYIPRGVAHGYLTLVDGTEAGYWISDYHSPVGEAGVRWDDPAFGIQWPANVRVISERDRTWPLTAST
jgi:dTDP-4-dehydrorhamnose 3,5-epimerase